ncbi:DUF2793 domain-containing protein [Erythrobacter sp. R86502]|uniref:DUF2793 domain-containing protein n=1 Tax=Erythrobacter sp. R86502 TaxID=3093846 RepID=UPI0036D39472
MPEPIAFPSTTPLLGMPLLIPGQAQKEFFINKSVGLLDALSMGVVKASRSSPPDDAEESDCYRITKPATGLWVEQDDSLAVRIGGGWHFVAPFSGMRVFDQTEGHLIVFRSQWESAPQPSTPAAGTTIDTEARAAIVDLIQSLQMLGMFTQEPL